MHAAEAVKFLTARGSNRWLALPPGWDIDAIQVDDWHIAVRVGFETQNSNEVFAPDYTGDAFTAASEQPLMLPTRNMTTTDMCEMVIFTILEKYVHEVREFVRYRQGSRWIAPFHPHRDEGKAAWERAVSMLQL